MGERALSRGGTSGLIAATSLFLLSGYLIVDRCSGEEPVGRESEDLAVIARRLQSIDERIRRLEESVAHPQTQVSPAASRDRIDVGTPDWATDLSRRIDQLTSEIQNQNTEAAGSRARTEMIAQLARIAETKIPTSWPSLDHFVRLSPTERTALTSLTPEQVHAKFGYPTESKLRGSGIAWIYDKVGEDGDRRVLDYRVSVVFDSGYVVEASVRTGPGWTK